MKKFAVIALLLGCLPFIAYIMFNHSDQNIGMSAARPLIGTSVAEIMPDGDYTIRIAPEKMPLQTGRQIVDLTLSRTDQKPMAGVQPSATLTMPMDGKHPMIEPVTVTPDKAPGEYTLSTNFSMPGHWYMDVQPTPSYDAIRFRITAQNP